MVKPTMRAKMVVQKVEQFLDKRTKKAKKKKVVLSENLHMTAICKSNGYPEDGSDENNTFARFTPLADLVMSIQNPGLHGVFKKGDELYVDFTFCNEHK